MRKSIQHFLFSVFHLHEFRLRDKFIADEFTKSGSPKKVCQRAFYISIH